MLLQDLHFHHTFLGCEIYPVIRGKNVDRSTLTLFCQDLACSHGNETSASGFSPADSGTPGPSAGRSDRLVRAHLVGLMQIMLQYGDEINELKQRVQKLEDMHAATAPH